MSLVLQAGYISGIEYAAVANRRIRADMILGDYFTI